MNSIKANNYTIHFNEDCYVILNKYLQAKNYSNIFVLVDNNTHNHCVPYFFERLETTLTIEIIEIEAGEEHKTIDTCSGVWNALSELNGDRKSLMINLGGGVITDLGGFVASTFKRGIDFINVPTSLLAMVDASVGGKTGVDLGHLKNQIGVINTPEMVLVDTNFLNTLPQDQMLSGSAEMLKHGLISNETYWNKLIDLPVIKSEAFDTLIYDSILIKNDIVDQDPFENNLRKTLNFGHTLGHAIESYFLSNPNKVTLLHGEAIAIGMVLACYISKKMLGFSSDLNLKVKQIIINSFGKVGINLNDYSPIIELLKHDKKNERGNIYFVLLEDIGKAKTNCLVNEDLIIDAFNFYNN